MTTTFIGPPRRMPPLTDCIVLSVRDKADADRLRTQRQSAELVRWQSQQRAGCIERYTSKRWQATALNLVSAALIGALLACGLVYGWSDVRGDVPVPSVGK